MTTPLITIGLPVYNARPFLEDTLRSVFAQTVTDWELLAVDDGSTDGSGAFLAQLRDPRVHVLLEKENRGLAARLNFIHAHARGRYIARMDADDMMHPERLARQLAFLERNSGIDVLGCSLVSLGHASEPKGARVYPAEHEQLMGTAVVGPLLCHATVIARAEWWRRFRYNESNRGCEDLELWLAAHRSSRFANLPDLLYYYREYASFLLAKYLRNRAHVARVAWRERQNGILPALVDVAAHLARGGVYVGATALGLRDRLIARRSAALAPAEREACIAAIARIRATPLPMPGKP
ncbi:MAG: glycosyltransferase family 2 protein [Candidatus Koribacter versatilis]|uniref:Glycosyltransferase family 2 protein n=1 Tax=Candidatus Korobacter versatilis TaxID=658062 RepID=A0A932A6M6_9BACT|nr:glycosyltransferase family 2 protein [Candidatus Koribacter versatilis]